MSQRNRNAIWLLLFAGLIAAPASAELRNVLLIISDDQGLDLGVYGNKLVRTPNIDGLAKRGTLFTQGFATVSSCSPSRSVILTGLYSHSNGMYGLAHDIHNQHLLPWVETLPQLLKAAGYRTGLVGKKHILPERAFPFDAELAPEQPGNRDVAFMADEAKRFMEASSESPFFLVVGFSDPHRAPKNFGNTRDWPRVSRQTYTPSQVVVPPHLPDVPEVREDLAQYYESLSRLDSGVGLLLDGLRATGNAENTLIIYVSDNGRPFPGATGWDHIFASHSSHEIQQYYPMRALRTRQHKYIVNLAAEVTFPIAGDIQSSPSWHAIQARPAAGLGTRTLEAFLHRPAEELYDLTKDPHEVRNMANDPEYRAVLNRMRADMAEFRAATRDPWLPGQSSAFGL